MKLEYCCLCDEPTGNAGKLDGSNYAEDGTGAYCDSCFAAYNAGLERAAEIATNEVGSRIAEAIRREIKDD